jgi:hypothetical protein
MAKIKMPTLVITSFEKKRDQIRKTPLKILMDELQLRGGEFIFFNSETKRKSCEIE